MVFAGFINTKFLNNQRWPCDKAGVSMKGSLGDTSIDILNQTLVNEFLDMDWQRKRESWEGPRLKRTCYVGIDSIIDADGIMPLPVASAVKSKACAVASPAPGARLYLSSCISLSYQSEFVNNTGPQNGGVITMRFRSLTTLTAAFNQETLEITDRQWRLRVVIVGSRFAYNSASEMGGALLLRGTGQTRVEYIIHSTTFEGNAAKIGGAISLPAAGPEAVFLSLVAGTHFSKNVAADKVRLEASELRSSGASSTHVGIGSKTCTCALASWACLGLNILHTHVHVHVHGLPLCTCCCRVPC